MSRGYNQRLKIVYLMKILFEKTDETHGITMPEIISSLEFYGITSERKSIYNGLENLRQYGIDIIGEQLGRTYYYRIGNRRFQLAELKLLVDSVQSAKFITEKKSKELIKKIESLASKYEATQLQRQVYVSGRVKTMNESIYYNVDVIHSAISSNSKITFQYFQWDVNKQMVLKKNGELYQISPWALLQDDENYYMIAYDSVEEKIKHFRVDKMLHIEVMDLKREGKEYFNGFDIGQYSKKMFGMFGGEERVVKLKCANFLAGVIIDRFGKDTIFTKVDEEHFLINIKVALSRQFFAWVMALGDGVKIMGPEPVLAWVNGEIKRLEEQYK